MEKQPEVSVGALIFHNGKILLIKSWKWGNRYTLPGGHVEFGEKLKDAVKREVKEEVGIEVNSIKFLNLQEAINSKEFSLPKHFIFIDFICKAKSSKVKINKKEVQDYLWVTPEKALNLNIDSFTKKTIKKYLEEVRKWK